MKHYIIDGNNLIGKIKSLKLLQKKDKQASREKLAFMVEKYFGVRNANVTLHFDGYPKEEIRISGIKINYSNSQSADDNIKHQIERSKNPRNIIVITSDANLKEFSRVCGCRVNSSETFSNTISIGKNKFEEEERINQINNVDEFKKIFGAD